MSKAAIRRPKTITIIRNFVLWMMTAGGTAISVIFGPLAGQGGEDQTRNLILTTVGALGPVIAAAISQVRAYRAKRGQEEIEGRSILAVRTALSTAVHFLREIAAEEGKDKKQELMGSFMQSVVTAAVTLSSAPKSRCGFFRINGDTMKCTVFNGTDGRADRSDTVFTKSSTDKAGEAMFRLVKSGEFAHYPDIRENAPPGLEAGRSYRTFIAAAVIAGEKPYGVLTIDSPEANSFGERDTQIMRMLAILMAAGLALLPESA
ncbi:GAF domain-containing protein [Streptosporangium amethystogenes]|uniref:GAF domain-containing protein n=1 Tax=Streptosporangium amethystogenes TaxID=2002 RepID=UPI0012FC8F9B|nr:GAF domain-containing protein [Streptosporangium amethystogenes]